MSVALEICRMAEERVGPDTLALISALALEVGDQSGVEPANLEFWLDVLPGQPPFRGAKVVMNRPEETHCVSTTSRSTMSVRVIEVRERVLARNDEIARDVRARIEAAGVLALNLVSSPGSGKTTLLERTLDALGSELSIAIVTGDVQTQNDADRLARHTSRLVHAVVTGGACHLDASQVATSLDAIDLDDTDILFIENVGNLVCPAAWDLGEAAKIVLFSVTEGEDKPVKYPRMFQEASHAVISKADLLPYVP
jgi:hydrogenase nickel incorporation protein HypB